MPITAFGWDADVLISATPSLLATNENATDSGNHIIYNMTIHKYWDDSQPITFQTSPDGTTGWATVPPAQYTFQACGGVLTFLVARTVGTNDHIRILSGYYMTTSRLAEAHEWSLELKTKIGQSTRFQTAWEENTILGLSGVAKIKTYVSDITLLKEMGNRLVLVLYTDKTIGTRWECYAILTTDAMKWPEFALVTQDADFALDSPAYYYAN